MVCLGTDEWQEHSDQILGYPSAKVLCWRPAGPWAYLLDDGGSPIVGFGDDFIFSVVDLKEVDIVRGVDGVDDGVFVHKELRDEKDIG